MPDNIILQLKDWYLGPLFFILILFFSYRYKKKCLQNSPFKKYFIAAILCRVLSSVSFAFMYQFLYKYGDTFGYHKGAEDIYNSFYSNPLEVIKLYFTGLNNLTPESSSLYDTFLNLYSSPSVALTTKLISVIALFTNNSYIANGMIMSCLSFIGCWKIFKVFANLYPSIIGNIAFAVLFLPSVFFWSSGVIKEPFCLLGLGFIIECLYFIFIVHSLKWKYIIQVAAGVFLLSIIKPYILIALIIAFIPWMLIANLKKIKNVFIKRTVIVGLVIIIVTIFFTMNGSEVSNTFNGIPLSAEMVKEKLQNDALYQSKVTEDAGGSGYNIPMVSSSFSGLLNLFFFGVNVTYFRPYIWEIKKAVVIPLGIESLFNLIFTIFVLFRSGFVSFFKTFFVNTEVLFCMIYALLLGAVVGIEASNFGTLVRFKAPCASFYLLGLMIIYYECVSKKKQSGTNYLLSRTAIL